ncbi:hypothetical protein BT63DRAFT_416490 [Microthyrium microscopicum]|uniref:SAM and PH domain-containing protein n=1 Tax=Microthyrium microscopicum TaxID=703497 RepID=A0A6A6U323_9PEZI|nr:hypothetical protein BT63DRAFT_416490 [Microthyrium microscopicum]
MEPPTPITPLDPSVEMFSRGHPKSIMPIDIRLAQRLSIVPEVETPSNRAEFLEVPRLNPRKPRPLSEVTEIYSDNEDDIRSPYCAEDDIIEEESEPEYEDDTVEFEMEPARMIRAEQSREQFHGEQFREEPIRKEHFPEEQFEEDDYFEEDYEEDEYDDHSDDSQVGSEFEEDSEEGLSPTDMNGAWRQSNSTLSTVDDIQTPRSSRRLPSLRLNIMRQSCEGPRGPHLFRSSTASSAEFLEFDRALQLSPIGPDYLRSPDSFYRQSAIIDAAFDKMDQLDTPTTAITETAYTIPPLGWGWQSEDPHSWTAQQVSIWMQESRMESSIIQMFADNDISGTILLDLEFADLKDLGITSFGKRHQVWNHICTLRDNNGHISPKDTPFDESEAYNRHSSHSKRSQNSCETPLTAGPRRKKKTRGTGFEPITPADSVSIVAIEQLLPKPHKCPKGENCPKWRKQQKLRKRVHEEHGLPISPENGGQIFMAGNPGNPSIAQNIVENVRQNQPHPLATEYRPTSEAVHSIIGPSVVASSDLLGPGEQPDFSLDPDALKALASRDPQDNVRIFLALQNLEPPTLDPNAVPDMRLQGNLPRPLAKLQALPPLSIPRDHVVPFHYPENPTSAGPTLSARDDYFSPCYTAAETPIGASVYRFGTPASDMDVPVTQPPLDPTSRETSQSVPPNMQFRDPIQRSGSRAADWRRTSFQLAPLVEEPATTTFAMQMNHHGRAQSTSSAPSDTVGSPTVSFGPSVGMAPSSKTSLDIYDPRYPNVTHSGWMKKRKTKMLRHEWHEHHFRLNGGAQLTMHRNDLPASSPQETLNIDEYAVACSSIANNKLSAKLKAMKIHSAPKDAPAPQDSAFSFQLVPARPNGEEAGKLRKVVEGKKTHHFAVKNRDERIDWMRELMLAKALREKEGSGYEVEVNRGEKTSLQAQRD